MIITIVLVLAAAVGGFIAGILVGRKNAKAVNAVISTAEKAAADIKKI
jgi:hypothetical protein